MIDNPYKMENKFNIGKSLCA